MPHTRRPTYRQRWAPTTRPPLSALPLLLSLTAVLAATGASDVGARRPVARVDWRADEPQRPSLPSEELRLMPVNTKAIGKTYEPVVYAVGREKIREYARAVGETNPLHLDVQVARAAGYADLVAPPMFAVVYSAPSVGPPIFDPELELNFAMMVHGAQQFEWGPVVVAGDEITTTTSVRDISEADGRGYYVFESISTNQRGEQVCRGTWTNIVRGV
jgi:acyl dehydratase